MAMRLKSAREIFGASEWGGPSNGTQRQSSKGRNACLLAAIGAVAAILPGAANAQTLLLDIKATNFNPTTDVLTPSVVPNGTFGMTLDGPAPTFTTTPNGSLALNFSGSTGFDFNQVVPGTNGGVGVTILAFVEPSTPTSQPGTLVAAGSGSIDYRIAQVGNSGTVGAQDLLAAQQKDFGTSNTALSNTAFNIIDVTIPAGAGTANFRLNGQADGSVSVDRAELGISRFAAAQLNAAGGDQEQYSGSIAELQYYSGILSSAQIQAVENQFTASYVTPLNSTQLTWTGGSSSTWDTTSTNNFATPSGMAATFVNGADSATFADFFPGTTTPITASSVTIQNGGVKPISVTVSSSSVNYTFSDSDGIGINGSTGIVKSGASTLTLASSNTFTGPVQISSGSIVVGANGALGSTSGVTITGGNLSIQAGVTLPSTIPFTLGTGDDNDDTLAFNQSSASSNTTFSNPITLTADATIGVAQGSLNFATSAAGAGGLSFNTVGPITISGTNTYTGQTTVTGGSVTLTGSINGAAAPLQGDLHVAPNSNGVGRFVIAGGTANFTDVAGSDIAIGYNSSGALVVNSGTLSETSSIQIGPNLLAYGEVLLNGGSANFKGTVAVGAPYGTGVVTLSAGSAAAALGSPGLLLAGGQTSVNVSTGIVTLNGGTLTASSIQGNPTGSHLNFNGGILKANASTPAFITSLQSAFIYSGGAIIDDGGNAITIPQSLLTPAGSGVSANSIPAATPGTGYAYAPIVQITGGTLSPNGAQATAVANYSNGQVVGIIITNPGSYTSTAGLTASFVGGGGTAPTLAAIPTATNVGGGFTKKGSGTVTLTGSNTYTGPTAITAGKLQVATPGTAVPIADPKFDAVAAGGFTYFNNTTSGLGTDGYWNYYSTGGGPGGVPGAGITDGSSGFGFQGSVPGGTQAAFIQGTGAIQQTLNFPTTGNYTISFYNEQRVNANATTQVLDVDIDNPTSGGLDVTPGGFIPQSDWTLTTLVFPETAGSHVLTIQGLDPDLLDNTAYVTGVSLFANYNGGSTTNSIPSASPVVISDNAALDINSSFQTIGSLTGTSLSQVTLGSGILTTGDDGSSTNFAGVISGTGSVVKIGAGAQTFSGANNYSGGTNVSGGVLIFGAPGALPLFTSLTVGTGGEAAAAIHNSSSPKNTLFVAGLSIAGGTGSWTGTVDLGNNDMVVRNGSLGTISNQAAQGYGAGTWQGSGGIVSSAAAADTSHLTALGVIQNSVNGLATGTAIYTSFDGQTVSDADVLVKYTYYGDTNLDGHVDGSDYSRIDNGAALSLTGWFNGDFNYDGVINGSDYTLIDNAYNTQGASIAASIASPTAEVASSSVPEPAALSLLVMGSVGLIGRRRMGRHLR